MNRAFAVLALTLGLAVVPASAHAEKWTADDPEGDVTGWHHVDEPAPCGTTTDLDASAHENEDLVRFSVQHTRKELRFVAQFRGFDRALEQGAGIYIQTPTRAFQLDVDRHLWTTQTGQHFKVTADLSKPTPEPTDDEVGECGIIGVGVRDYRCKIARAVDLDTSTITASLPRSCVRNPDWVRVGVRATGWDFPQDWSTAGYSIYSDTLGDHAEGESEWNPPLGPEVHAPAQRLSPSKRSLNASSSTGTRRSFVTTLTGFPIGTTAATAY